jgi:hypothetical protein
MKPHTVELTKIKDMNKKKKYPVPVLQEKKAVEIKMLLK